MNTDEERRRLILDAAERLLRHYGPGKTTMAEIAREAAIGVGTVYLQFDSKDAIIEELSNRRHDAMLEAMRDAARRAGNGWSAKLSAMIDAKVDAMLRLADEGLHAPELLHCSTKAAVKLAQDRFRSEERAMIAGLLGEAMQAGEFEPRDPAHCAATVLAAYASFAPPWVFHQSRDEVFRLLRAMHELVLRGLLRRDPVKPAPRGRR
jgi:AcrR family transcriptional regulator